ncbi:type II toxin-antitoxin system VapC family toxin [Pedobacter foliorum]|uniref:type II toxin-antitoxin system VapC family toxin n=1 Tax=Pedobacter foliorum TaxID=2739058 RepID=UPI001567525D|nr:type II toxin-antitoxin system VapC family toxin [Pedobacter foliorum]NRF41075.1 type II toxin-antitoxin system VapC family toxin [Pedobacter foliorum]
MAFLLDSNVIIYSYSSEYEYLRGLIINELCIVSEISRVEVLGYHGLKKEEEKYFKDIFEYATIILPDQDIFDRAIEIRKKYNLKLGDSLIAATASVHGLEIYTRNLSDFERVRGLKCINPIR